MKTAVSGKPVNKWMVLLTVCLGLFMIMLQSNVINVAISRIQADMKCDLMTVQWITSGYLLAFTMLLITFGRLGDALGRKAVFLGGLAVYVAGCAFSAFAGGSGIGMLILGAVIQGIGGAAMMPATQSIIASTFPAEERGMALGIWGAVSGLAVAIGPTLGGVLTEYGLGATLNAFFGIETGWRYVYFLNVLLGVIVFAMSCVNIPESRADGEERRFDIVGVVLSSFAIFALVFGINKATTYGWFRKKADFTIAAFNLTGGDISVVPFCLVIAIVLLVVFVFWERKRGEHALMDVGLFANRDFTAGSITTAILSFSMMGTSFLVPVFLQGVLKFSAIKAGLSMLPMAIAVMIASPVAGKLSDKFGSKVVVALGLLVMGLGSFALANFSASTSIASMIVPFLIVGAGIGLAMSPITAAALRKVPSGEVGSASGVLSMIRQFGSVLGIAILATLFSGYMATHSVEAVKSIDPSLLSESVKEKIVDGIESGNMKSMSTEDQEKMLKFYTPAKREKIKTAMSEAMTGSMCSAINETFRIAASVALLGFVTALFLSGKKKEEK